MTTTHDTDTDDAHLLSARSMSCALLITRDKNTTKINAIHSLPPPPNKITKLQNQKTEKKCTIKTSDLLITDEISIHSTPYDQF